MQKILSLVKRQAAITAIKHSRYFDAAWYLRQQGLSDLTVTEAATHYFDGGWVQCDPSIVFSQKKYLRENPDVAISGACPLSHYLLYGKREGRKSPANSDETRYFAHRLTRGVKRTLYQFIDQKLIKANSNARILVIVHIYYERYMGELSEYLRNLQVYDYRLVITTTETRDVDGIRAFFSVFKPDAEIRVYPNIGFDIAPFIDVINSIDLNQYDIVLKLQSKRHFSAKGTSAADMYVRGRDWFLYLHESTIGAQYIHRNIHRLISNPRIQLIAASNLLQKDFPHKQHFTLQHLANVGLSLPIPYQFVAGSCFICSANALKPIQSANILIDDFGPSERGYYSFAHAMERYITGVIPAKNQYGNNVCIIRQITSNLIGRKTMQLRGQRLYKDPRFQLSDDLMLRFLEHRRVYRYELVEIPAGDLYVARRNRRVALKDCVPYLYLTGDEDSYIEYCRYFRRSDYMGLSNKEYMSINDELAINRYQQLIEEMDRFGYSEKKPIVVRDHNEIIDGQHRACYLLFKHGETHMIKVLKVYTKNTDFKPLPIATAEEAKRIYMADLKRLQKQYEAFAAKEISNQSIPISSDGGSATHQNSNITA